MWLGIGRCVSMCVYGKNEKGNSMRDLNCYPLNKYIKKERDNKNSRVEHRNETKNEQNSTFQSLTGSQIVASPCSVCKPTYYIH